MRIGTLIDVRPPVEEICEEVARQRDVGLASAWTSQIFGYDALTLLAVVGSRVEGIELGTAVVPVYSRLPQVMAQQALTVQAVTGGRLALGVGLSHQVVVESMWGLSYDRPVAYLREYLGALVPMLAGETVQHRGERLTALTTGPLEIPAPGPPPVLVAALGPAMLRLAGSVADGTVTWMTGRRTVAEHVVPTIAAAARDARRPGPRVVVSLPVTVSDDAARAKVRIDEALAIYPTLPSYRAMLEREGATRPSEVSLVGDERVVESALAQIADAGATDFVASIIGDRAERDRTAALLGAMAGSFRT